MSGFSAEIGVTAKVDGAIGPLTQLADTTDKITTATEAAGAAQANLSKQVESATKASKEATVALNAVKQATEDAALTARAFGTESKEAAEAQARLTKATELARAATAKETAALADAKANLDKVSAGADRVSPALKKAADALDRNSAAAERNGQELRKLELTQLANSKASGKAAGGFDLAGFAGGKLAGVLGPAALGATLIATAGWLSEAANKTLQFETAIANLPFALHNAQEATHGLITESSLAVSASQALALGVVQTEAQFNQLASDASKIALKLGVSSDQMLGDLTTALGRGSAMILDNAGIILKVSDANEAYAKSIGKAVSELSEIEKKQAFQIAAMKAIRESADATTVAYDSNAAAVARTSVQLDNMWDSFSRGASNAAGAFLKWNEETANQQIIAEQGMDAMQWIPEYAANAEAAAAVTKKWNDEADDGPITMTQWALATWRLSDASKSLQTIFESEAWTKAKSDSKDRADAMSKEADFAERQAKAYAKLAAEQEAHLDAQAMASITYGPAAPPKKSKGKGGKKSPEALSNDAVAQARIGEGRDDTNAIALEAGIIERTNAAAAEAAAIDENIAARERGIEAIDREIEAREAAGLATDDLLARRFDQERELQDYTIRNVKDRSRAEESQTRFQKQQHDKRLRDLRATYAAEKKEQDKRQAHLQIMSGAVEGFSSAVVGAMDAEAEGSKGAVAKSLAAWLKGIRNQMIVKGAVELAWVAASAATFNPVGVAAHGTAAALAFAAAAAAGIAGAAIGAAVPSDSGGAASASAGAGAGAASSPPSGGGSSGGDGNEKQKVPVSYEQSRRDADMPPQAQRSDSAQAPVTINIKGGYIGDERKLAAELDRVLRKAPREGKRF